MTVTQLDLRSTRLDSRPLVVVDARYLRRPDVGIGVYLHHAVAELTRLDLQVELVTDDLEHREELSSNWPAAVCTALPARSGIWFEQVSMLRHLRSRAADVMLAPANWGVPYFYRGRTRTVLVVHDLIPLKLPRMYLSRRPAWALKYLLSTFGSARRADSIVVDSLRTGVDVKSALGRDSVLIYPAVGETEPSAMNGGPSGDYFVYSGGFDPRKNLETLLRAYRMLLDSGHGYELVITGTPPEQLLSLVRGLGLADRVRFAGRLDEPALEELVAGAAAAVYPSLLEGFGLPVVEAIRVGVPVLTGPGTAEAAGEVGLVCDVTDPAALAAGMRAVIEPSVRERTRRLGPAHLRSLTSRSSYPDVASFIGELVAGART